MADEHIPMEFYTDEQIAVDLGEVMPIGGSSVSVQANYNQTDPNAPDYIIGRENIVGKDELATYLVYISNINYNETLAFDTTELVIGGASSPILGQGMLGYMVLA
jgi:hypothetical protein